MGRLADVIREGVSMPDQKRRQILFLDEEFSALEADNKALKSENLMLKAKVNPLERQVKELEARIQRQDSASLDDVSEEMLIHIANGVEYKEQLIQAMQLSKGKFDYHFDILEKRKFAIETSYGGMGTGIDATPDGREYLAQKGKL